jgi:hypothetical protein
MPAMLITIDCEGDNLWSRPRIVTTHNARYLFWFQSLCERYGMRPTYLVNYEMALSEVFQEFAAGVLHREAAEIGMHLHAWNSPPFSPLTPDDHYYQPYLFEYPSSVMRAKVGYLTKFLEDTFQTRVVSHRAGRWGLDHRYARMLVDHGFNVDCSVTPHVSWRNTPGDPRREGGPDFTDFHHQAYFLDLDDISRAGSSPLLEVPISIVDCPERRCAGVRKAASLCDLALRVLNHFCPPVCWLQPNGRNRRDLFYVIEHAKQDRRDYLQLTLHSSELMPGCSPAFPTRLSIARLQDDLEAVFATIQGHWLPATLREYHRRVITTRVAMPMAAAPFGSGVPGR